MKTKTTNNPYTKKLSEIRHDLIWGNWSKILRKAEQVSHDLNLNEVECAELLQNFIVYCYDENQKTTLFSSYTDKVALNRSFPAHIGTYLERSPFSKLSNQPDIMEHVEELLFENTDAKNPETIFIKKELVEAIREWLQQEKYPHKFVDLYYLKGYSSLEIAKIFDISPKTVTNAIRNFINRVRSNKMSKKLIDFYSQF